MRQGGGQPCGNGNEQKFVAPVRERRVFNGADEYMLSGRWEGDIYVVYSSAHRWMVYMPAKDWWFICQASDAWVGLLTGGVWLVPSIDDIERIVRDGMRAVTALRIEGRLV